MPSDLKAVKDEYGRDFHVEDGDGTSGKRDAKGVPRLYVEVRDETGAVVYETWQSGPVSDWKRATLYFDKSGTDAEGRDLGLSIWD